MFADEAGTTTKMVPTNVGGHIPAIYSNFVEVISKAKMEALPPHRSIDHAPTWSPATICHMGGFTIYQS